MDATPRLQLPYIAPQQAQKQVTYNQAMRALDLLVQPSVKSRSLAAPPAGPAEGDAYVVAPAATGAWAGRDGQLATLLDGAWSFRAAPDGWQVYVEDSTELVIRQASAWAPFVSNGGSAVARFGINTPADDVNRLALASAASLFTHEGAGHRLKLNKAAAADTGSVLFQTGSSGRAELGLAGDDDFHLKVSPDGSTWYEALTVARTTGQLRLPRGQLAFPATQNPSTDPNTLDDYREGSFTATLTGCTTSPTVTVNYTRVGNIVTLGWSSDLVGTSNTTACTITGIPVAIRPAAQRIIIMRVKDNGTGAIGIGVISTGGDVTLYATPTGGAFTGSGFKGAQASEYTFQIG